MIHHYLDDFPMLRAFTTNICQANLEMIKYILPTTGGASCYIEKEESSQ